MTNSITHVVRGAMVAVMVLAGLTIGAVAAHADTTLVHPGDMAGWAFAAETGDGTGSLVLGPDTPPLGTGSANLLTDSGDDGTILGKLGYVGLPFADVDALSYSTYVDAASASTVQVPALQFNADDDVTDLDDSWKGRLVFEPYYSETVNKGEWQTWDTMTEGRWWGTGAVIAASCSMGAPCTWDELLTAFPNVGVNSSFGGVLFKAGSSWPAPFDGNVDALTIVSAAHDVDDTYDFEAVHPTSGEILEPEEDEIVFGMVDLVATYDDGDDVNDDAVQWAVREGTCAPGSNVAGNVGGLTDPYDWDGADFSATVDTAGWAPGMYCFVFNPTDDAGQDDIRETREFFVAETHVNGGGQILEGEGGKKKKDQLKISFGGWTADIGELVGEWEVNFHNVGSGIDDKSKFHTTEITDLVMFDSDAPTCEAAVRIDAVGTFNGMDDWKLIIQGGDSDLPASTDFPDDDTVRIRVLTPGGATVYDTHDGGEFTDESSCVGTARTGLDNGNITIVDNS